MPYDASAVGFAWMRTAGFCPPLMVTSPTPGNCEIFCANVVSARSSHFVQRHGVRGHGQRQDRRIRRIHLAVDRRSRQVGRQKRLRAVDGGLHFLLGHVDVLFQRELQRNHRCAERTARRHLVQAGQLSKLPLQRRGDRRGRDVRAGARIKRHDLDGWVIHLRQAPKSAVACRPRCPPAAAPPSAAMLRSAAE